ncbi:hypothetical protein DITRI_Ditri05aG0159000 [Diplodiscus trichospermus]
MEDNSSTKEVTAKGAPVYYPNPWSFHEVIRAILRCLGLEPEFHQNPSCPKKEDDGKVRNNQAAGCQEFPLTSSEEGPDPPSSSTSDTSDPPSTVTDPAADDPASTSRDPGTVEASLAAPRRPGTSSGSGPQIN